MYFAAGKFNTTATHCLGAATSKTVKGPCQPLANYIACPANSLGAFDVFGIKDWANKGDWSLPSGPNDQYIRRTSCPTKVNGQCGNSYVDNAWSEGGYGGTRYIVYKWQNKDRTAATPLTLQQVDYATGVKLIGDPVILLNHETGDSGSIEGPAIFKTPGGKYVLTFSKGSTFTAKYTVSYAVASNIKGPYTRMPDLLVTGDYNLNGPGGAQLSWNGYRMVFHEMQQPIGQKYNGVRTLLAANVDVDETTGEITLLSV